MDADGGPPAGYVEPLVIWCVNYVDPRQLGEGSFTIGAFTTQEQAQRLLDTVTPDEFMTDIRLNMIAVHQRVEDWTWDR